MANNTAWCQYTLNSGTQATSSAKANSAIIAVNHTTPTSNHSPDPATSNGNVINSGLAPVPVNTSRAVSKNGSDPGQTYRATSPQPGRLSSRWAPHDRTAQPATTVMIKT